MFILITITSLMVEIDVMFQFLGALYDFMIIKLMVIVIGFGAVPKYAMPEKHWNSQNDCQQSYCSICQRKVQSFDKYCFENKIDDYGEWLLFHGNKVCQFYLTEVNAGAKNIYVIGIRPA